MALKYSVSLFRLESIQEGPVLKYKEIMEPDNKSMTSYLLIFVWPRFSKACCLTY